MNNSYAIRLDNDIKNLLFNVMQNNFCDKYTGVKPHINL